MGEVVFVILLDMLTDALYDAAKDGIKYVIRKTFDGAGRAFTEFVHQIDIDGDGVFDEEIVLHSLDMLIPDLSGGHCIVSDGETIGLGMPVFDIIDSYTLSDYIDFSDTTYYPTVSGNGGGYLLDMDYDGVNDEVLVSLPDFTGDGLPDWGWVRDDDNNGVPDASSDSPYYPVGSEEYMDIVGGLSGGKCFIIMSADGTMTVYDEGGNITAEDCDTAYSLWVSENGILDKPFANYTVTEGLLFIGFVVGAFAFFKKIFRKRRV